jgi:hypothetical protein
MGAPIRGSEDSEPLRDELPKNQPSRNGSLRDPSRQAGPVQPERTPESVEPPPVLRIRRGVFEGDAAAVELRAQLARPRKDALTTRPRDEAPLPAVRRSSAGRYSSVVPRGAGILLMAAAAAGAAGYLAGGSSPFGGLSFPGNPPQAKSSLAGAGEADATPEPRAALEAAVRDSPMPAVRTAAVDLAPADARPLPEAVPPPAPQGVAPPPVSTPPPQAQPPQAQDPAEVAAKMKIGADLIASGDIAAARTMFERVAEAGDAAGAFALAETYDPVVLKKLRLRGGIKSDPAMARRWYEKARDMGSSAAIERIARLAANPAR